MSGLQMASNQDVLPHHSIKQASRKGAVVHLDSKEFKEAIEDVEFRRDLKRACQRVFTKYQQSTHGSCEDLQQEVLMRFGKWLPQYQAKAKMRTIFEKIATNLLIDANRRETAQRRKHEEIDLDALQHETIGNNPWNGIETRIFLDECRSSLSETECRILDEYFDEGCSLRQIAARHSVSATTIQNKVKGIITKLNEHQKLQRISIAEAA